jgi:Transposase DDE domain
LAQVARVERRRWIKGRESVELAYLITSLPPDQAGPARLLALARDHWAIENRLHHVRDTSFREDQCRVRAGARPLATLRNLALTLIRRAGLHVPEARENFRKDRAAAIALATKGVL